jgi:adenosylcobyric acid synthase
VSGALLVAGTASDAGKSVVVAGICRWLRRRGVRVAPFKAQNMSLNAAVTADGREIGRAQAAQAAAAGVPPEAAMNPVLIKPTSEHRAQVVVMGRPLTDVDASSYRDLQGSLMPTVLGALEELRARFDVVVCEGAGGIAEINLRASDIANMGLARAAALPVVVVGDIDRGGVFASAFGSLALLEPRDQALVRGFVVNKFRGDVSLLSPGIAELERRTGRSVLGVIPWAAGLEVDAEDSLALDAPPPALPPRAGGDRLMVAVVRLPRLSNFTDFDPLRAEPGVEVVFTEQPQALSPADLAVLPGTKATVADLAWLRSRSIDRVLEERARLGRPVLGICGGYQMLGRRVVDGVEDAPSEAPGGPARKLAERTRSAAALGAVAGLSLLPVDTVFGPDKVLARPRGVAPGFAGAPVSGYEIRHGRMRRLGGDPLFVGEGGGSMEPEGCRAGEVLGTSWHGIFEGDAFRREFLAWVAAVRGLRWIPGGGTFAEVRESRLDRLGDLVEEHLDHSALLDLLREGPRADLPTLVTGFAPGATGDDRTAG